MGRLALASSPDYIVIERNYVPAKPKELVELRPHGREEEASAPRADPKTQPPRRLVVELTRASAAILARFVREEDLNKTTIVNRALSVYSAVREAELAGDKIYIRDGKTGEITQLMMI